MVSLKPHRLGSLLPVAQQSWHWLQSHSKNMAVVVTTGLAVATSVMGLAQLGVLESLEQKAYDQMMRLRQETIPLAPDDRLLIVTVTEADLDALAEFPLSDGTVAQALDKLQQHEPVAIGLDIFRAIPKPPGRDELLRSLQAPNVEIGRAHV